LIAPAVSVGGVGGRTDGNRRGCRRQQRNEADCDDPGPCPEAPLAIGLPEQIKAVADVLADPSQPMTLDMTAANFSARGRWRDRLSTILETLEALGRAKRLDGDRWRDAGRS